MGLARAFRIAGARSLVVSLWEVDDAATAEFMARFYAGLIDGQAPAAALRSAKLSFLEDGRDAGDPAGGETRGVGRRPRSATPEAVATWSPFVLLGPGPNPLR